MNSNNQIPNLFEHMADKALLQNMDYESYKYYPDKRKKNTLNNNRCITECQLPGRTIYHPNNSIKITEFTGPFCATNSWYDENEHRTKYHDICNFYGIVRFSNYKIIFSRNMVCVIKIRTNFKNNI